MRALESKPDLSQRDLARELGVSLGKTHYCLRALIDKGHVKAVNFRNSGVKHRYLYCLTPKGIAAKSRIMRRFLQRKLEEREVLIKEIKDLKRDIRNADQQISQPDSLVR